MTLEKEYKSFQVQKEYLMFRETEENYKIPDIKPPGVQGGRGGGGEMESLTRFCY